MKINKLYNNDCKSIVDKIIDNLEENLSNKFYAMMYASNVWAIRLTGYEKIEQNCYLCKTGQISPDDAQNNIVCCYLSMRYNHGLRYHFFKMIYKIKCYLTKLIRNEADIYERLVRR